MSRAMKVELCIGGLAMRSSAAGFATCDIRLLTALVGCRTTFLLNTLNVTRSFGSICKGHRLVSSAVWLPTLHTI